MRFAALVLVGLLFANAIGLRFSSIATAPTFSMSFVGYGENTGTPVLHNATLLFYEGEELWVMSMENVQLRLTSPDGFVYTAVATAEPQILRKFTDADANGNWLLEQLSPEGVLSMTIELEKYVGNETAELMFNFEGDEFSTKIERKSQSLAAFLSSNGSLAITPEGLVSANLGTEYSGPVNVKIFSMEHQVVEGYSGNAQLKVEVTPLVANFSVLANNGLVEFLLPKIHEVGPGGMFPLRYGPIAVYVELSQAWGYVPPSKSEFYVFPFNPGLDVMLSSEVVLPIKAATLTNFSVVLANSKVVRFWSPVANVRVVDTRHDRYFTSEEFSMEIGDAQIWYDLNSAYVLYKNRTSLVAPENLTAIFEYELRIGGFVAENATPRTLTMKPQEELLIFTEACALKVRAVDLAGQPVWATLSINDTISVLIVGEASVMLPRGLYLLQARSGKESETDSILLEDDMDVTFTMGLHALIINILVAMGVVEALVIAFLAFSLRKASRKLALSFSPKRTRH